MMLVLLIPALWVSLALLLQLWGERRPVVGSWDAIIVPGAKVRPDGSASGVLERRTRHAVALYERGAAPLIVLTGGIGEHPPAEAAVAAELARALGVPAGALLLEAASTSTQENARFSARLTQARRVLVTTDGYHVWRCGRVFGRHFETVRAVGSRPPWPTALKLAVREVGVIAVYAVRGWL